MLTKYLIAISMVVSGFAYASDHIDGPATTAHPISDLADFYFFPSPNQEDHVVLILNTHFAAYKHNHFNEGIVYKFHLAESTPDESNQHIEHSNVTEIDCRFTVSADHSSDDFVSCSTEAGLVISGKTETNIELGTNKLFAGLRNDPFFFHIEWVGKFLGAEEGAIPAPTGTNSMERLNVLSIALEIDLKELFPNAEGSMFAAAASSSSYDKELDQIIGQLDWVGRPEITNITMAKLGFEDLRNDYNHAISPFHFNHKESWSNFHSKVDTNLKHFDELDGELNWELEDERKSFVRILMSDALVLDMSKPCVQGGNYFSIEKAIMSKTMSNAESCGGRLLEDDFIDVMLTYYVGGNSGTVVSDGADEPYLEPSEDFPYIREPEFNPKAWWARRVALLKKMVGGWLGVL